MMSFVECFHVLLHSLLILGHGFLLYGGPGFRGCCVGGLQLPSDFLAFVFRRECPWRRGNGLCEGTPQVCYTSCGNGQGGALSQKRAPRQSTCTIGVDCIHRFISCLSASLQPGGVWHFAWPEVDLADRHGPTFQAHPVRQMLRFGPGLEDEPAGASKTHVVTIPRSDSVVNIVALALFIVAMISPLFSQLLQARLYQVKTRGHFHLTS